MGKLDFLAEPEGSDANAAPEPIQEPAGTAESEGQPRGSDGKFAAKETAETPPPAPEPAPQPQPEPTPPSLASPPAPVVLEPTAPPPGYVPLAAVLDTRDKLKAAEAELTRLRLSQPEYQPPDRTEDPDAWLDHQQAQLQHQLHNQRVAFSRRLASVQHGAETVQRAHDWAYARCDADPLFNQRVATAEDPYELIVAEWKRDQVLTSLQGDDLDRFLAWKNARAASATPQPQALVQAQQPAPAPTPKPSPPPQSIAAAPSAGGPAAIPTGPGTAFSGLFRKG